MLTNTDSKHQTSNIDDGAACMGEFGGNGESRHQDAGGSVGDHA